ncbi:TlpA disulfide reductase family protein [Nocardioides sp. CFH 31398]|uniref:TlpA family protein disulfide reductase n=1 Tax=Nocardioides sp. CFH 31398 TaxID=2919579 RepID=UPI001F057B01|nr:TlpA disulfide reductase family protein [Nocardioides sp. CFH 31398]MCH1867787.1 TlpA family protein disulfide reductase [Nocardioides sp. CFH 31398]
MTRTGRLTARRAVSLVAVLLLVGAAVVACSGEDGGSNWSIPAIGPPDVEVDTPELREAKADAGIEDCPETTGDVTGELPTLTLECFGGGPSVDLSELRGPMVISVWAQWCTPCRNEMPELEKYHQRYGDEVPVLGIDFQDPQADEAMDFLAETGATYPQLADPGGVIDGAEPFPRLQGIPFLLFLDADGRVARKQFVIIDSPDELKGLVEENLGVSL